MRDQRCSTASCSSLTRFLRIAAGVFFLGTLSLGAACDGGGLGNPGALQDLADGQKQIMERLEKVEKSQQEILKSAKAAPRKRRQVDYNKVYDIAVGDSYFRGPKDAKVTLVEFSDFQCPYSKRVQPLITTLLEAYPDDLKHVYKNFPLRFHKRAEPAARACVAAGLQGKFWEMEKVLYDNPKKLEDGDLAAHAKQIGLNVELFEKDFQSEKVKKIVQADLATARKAQVTGTPTLFLNGKRVKDRSPEMMKKTIEALRDAPGKG
jgi:protein-disulfide isomerase